MIELHTGLPGNGKSLFTIAWLRDRANKEQRPVFYSGITLTEKGKELLGWEEIDAEKWADCPPGAIVVIDEAQRVFRPRSAAKEVPPHVAALETHRHGGIDLVLITQHPMLIDNAVRRLAGKHRHVMRVFGTQTANIHEWDAVRVDCEKPGRRNDSTRHIWRYDRSVYDLYKSAELHTVKRSIPPRLILLALVPVLLAAAVYYMYRFTKTYTDKGNTSPPAAEAKNGQRQGAASPGTAGKGADAGFDPVADAKHYLAMSEPRINGLPQSAPKYDELTKPTAVPVPAACIHSPSRGRCECYTQQGTRLQVDQGLCLDIARNGYFEEFDPNGNKQQKSVAALDRGGQAMPLSGADTRDRPGPVSSTVAVLEGDGYGVLARRSAPQPR